jgi:hypothetical protein
MTAPESNPATHDRWRRRLLAFQATYYLVTGLWPLVHLRSFEAITGPKVDEWLVHMVGLLAAVIGAALGVAAVRDRGRAAEVVVLSVGSALAFAAIDLWYGLGGRIPPIYVAESVVELALVAGVVFTRRAR